MDRDNLVENEEVDLGRTWDLNHTMGIPNRRGNTSRPEVTVEDDSGPSNDTDAAEQGQFSLEQSSYDGSSSSGQEMTSQSRSRRSPPDTPCSRHTMEQWDTNYKEAAIFLEEGVNNDKFTHHPRSREELPAYLMVHNTWFHTIDLLASLMLLALGFVESPCLDSICVPPQIHSSIEICLLILVAIQVYLKTRWIGWKTVLKHKRTLIKFATLAVMLVEAIVVLARSNSHFRVSRALRPIFLIDNQFCGGVRRFIRQILQSLPPILDMLGLVFFVMLIYSVFGFYLFGQVDPENFGSLRTSFISLFVLVTTANYPDVMMKSYNDSRWSAIFFISYLSVNLFFLMNLMLAVVYDAFNKIEKEKFRRLFLHKRKAAQHAFHLLVTKERQDAISFIHFEGLLKSYKGNVSTTEAYLVFKLLNQSRSGFLSLDEFYGIYDASLYSWRIMRSETRDWFHDFQNPHVKVALAKIKAAITSSWFEGIVCLFVLVNGVILLLQTWIMEGPTSEEAQNIYAPWVTYFFVGLYTIEAILKLLGLGIVQYFGSFWNIFDFLVTTMGIMSLILEVLDIPLFYVIILRPLRLLTLFRMKKRFRDVFGTAVILMPRLTSAVIVLLLIYYFFGMVGMECFHTFNLINCCRNTSVEQYFKFEEGSGSNAYFYLNNFESLAFSGVTLFELTVVNNWYVIMEGYAITTNSDWSRLFFMTFYVFTMIVMTIIVAFILEAFLFRIQYKQFLTKNEEQKKLSTEIVLSCQEIERILSRTGEQWPSTLPRNTSLSFLGLKSRTKEQLQKLMYTDEMDQWIAESTRDDINNQARIQAALLQIQVEGHQTPSTARHDRGEVVQVVEDEDDVTTIQRPVLPDVGEPPRL